MSLTKRELEFRIMIAKGPAGDQPGETVTLTGHRARVEINIFGGASQGECHIAIYGLPLELMNRLTVIGPVLAQTRPFNRVEVLAGDDKTGKTLVFAGGIFESSADLHGAPDASLNIAAYSSMETAMNSATATSFQGTASVHDIMAALAKKGGLILEDSGVTGSLSNPAFKGSILDQIRKCADAANINSTVELGTLAIWPAQGARTANVTTPVIGPGSGLVGYPQYSSASVQVQCEFLATARIGQKVQIKDSSLTPVNGPWIALSVRHVLAAEVPGGPWFTYLSLWGREFLSESAAS